MTNMPPNKFEAKNYIPSELPFSSVWTGTDRMYIRAANRNFISGISGRSFISSAVQEFCSSTDAAVPSPPDSSV